MSNSFSRFLTDEELTELRAVYQSTLTELEHEDFEDLDLDDLGWGDLGTEPPGGGPDPAGGQPAVGTGQADQ